MNRRISDFERMETGWQLSARNDGKMADLELGKEAEERLKKE